MIGHWVCPICGITIHYDYSPMIFSTLKENEEYTKKCLGWVNVRIENHLKTHSSNTKVNENE